MQEKGKMKKTKFPNTDNDAFRKASVGRTAKERSKLYYWFDYSEYSRKNWVLLNVCCLLLDIVKAMINKMFENKEYMDSLKKSS